MSSAQTVYVELLNEDIQCWRPVLAERLDGDYYRLVGPRPDDEKWPFATDDIVRCRLETLSGDFSRGAPRLVAYERFGQLNIDLDAEGRVVGIEVLGSATIMPKGFFLGQE